MPTRKKRPEIIGQVDELFPVVTDLDQMEICRVRGWNELVTSNAENEKGQKKGKTFSSFFIEA